MAELNPPHPQLRPADERVAPTKLAGRCIVAVHAHPDDESSKAAATIARYAAGGVRCVLVSCTDGRGGRTPLDSDRPLAEIRSAELDRAAAILGYTTVHRLSYRDSGMDATESDGFAHVPLDQVAAELHQILHMEQPDVVITYDPEYAAGHPDHRHAHDATVAAFATYSAERDRPAALYGTRTHSPRKLQSMHEWLTARSEPSPYADAIGRPDSTTTTVHVAAHLETAHRALRQHASQVDADDPWFFAVPTHALRTVYPYEDFTRLASTTGHDSRSKTDLFDGLNP